MSRKNRSQKTAAVVTTSGRQEKIKSRFIESQRFTRTMVLTGILAFTFAVFSNSLFNGFAYDDLTQILENQLIRSWSNLPDALTKEVWFWRVQQDKDPEKTEGPTTPYYRPVFMIYLMLGWQLFGASPAGWHLLNVLMHLLAVYLAFLILEKISGDLRVTGVATLLFAIHPLRSESVAWISGSTDLFLALFLLPSFYFYLRYREEFKRRDLAISVFFFLFAAFSKEPAVALPIFIAAYEIFIINRDKQIWQRFVAAAEFGMLYFSVAVIYFLMRYYALGFILSDKNYKSYASHHVLMTIPLVICKYIGLLFLPLNLSIFHYTEVVKSPLSYRFYLPTLFIAALSVGLWQLRKSRVALFAILWFAINLLPVLNLNAMAEDHMVQERYVYIPSIGFFLLIAMGLLKIPIERWITVGNRRTAQVAVVMLIALLLTGKTVAQNTVWKDNDTLWTEGAETASDQMMPNYILGHHYLRNNQPQKAIVMFDRYLAINPDNMYVISNLAAAHLQMYEGTFDRAHIDRAIALCERGLKLYDRNPALWDTLGHAYTYDTALKNYARARLFFQKALELQPDLVIANFHMGATYVKEGMYDQGILYLELASRQQADFPDTYKFLGAAYSAKGETQKAIAAYEVYVKTIPTPLDAAVIKQDLERLRAKLSMAQK